jgi:Zn finger protein HypA/HybF involved in hydrogenase expression
LVGGGMRNFDSVCNFPAYCDECSSLVQVNVLLETLRCPNCGSRRVRSYDHPDLQGRRGNRQVASWDVSAKLGRSVSLDDGTYLCPACGKLSLRFSDGELLWD